MVKDARSINPFGLRMPQELRGQLEAAAKENGVSLNTEIVQRLTRSLMATAATPAPYSVQEIVDRLVVVESALKERGVLPKRAGRKRRR